MPLEDKLARKLIHSRKTLSIAESCTGGLLAHRLTNVPGSSAYFLGGVTAYSDRVKTKLLKVPASIIKKHGAVSSQTVIKMAQGIRRILKSDYSAAITGILADPLFEQVMVVGEGRAYLGLLAVVNRERWVAAMRERNLPAEWPESLHSSQTKAYALQRVTQQLHAFPGYARIRKIALLDDPWTTDNGMLTPTLKIKRAKVLEHQRKEYAGLYDGY